MTDTDSFLFKVSDKKNFWKKFDKYMDYSNYPENHPKFSKDHKAELGYFKDELCAKYHCNEFVGLRSKCYAMSLIETKTKKIHDKKICKGIGRSAIKNRLKFQLYKKCLFEKKLHEEQFNSIRSTNHNIRTLSNTKRALSYLDTKRWIFNCGVHSVPFGSSLIQKYQTRCPRCRNAFKL
jgi:hypothetical protein